MAYSSSQTLVKMGSGNTYRLTITETEAASGSEHEIAGLPNSVRIVRRTCELTAGTGTTVDPICGTATNPSGTYVLLENGTAAARTVETPTIPVVVDAAAGFYHRSVVDAAADNSVTTVYLLAVGWV